MPKKNSHAAPIGYWLILPHGTQPGTHSKVNKSTTCNKTTSLGKTFLPRTPTRVLSRYSTAKFSGTRHEVDNSAFAATRLPNSPSPATSLAYSYSLYDHAFGSIVIGSCYCLLMLSFARLWRRLCFFFCGSQSSYLSATGIDILGLSLHFLSPDVLSQLDM